MPGPPGMWPPGCLLVLTRPSQARGCDWPAPHRPDKAGLISRALPRPPTSSQEGHLGTIGSATIQLWLLIFDVNEGQQTDELAGCASLGHGDLLTLSQEGTHPCPHYLPTRKLALSREPRAMQAVWGPQWHVCKSKPRGRTEENGTWP